MPLASIQGSVAQVTGIQSHANIIAYVMGGTALLLPVLGMLAVHVGT